MERQDIQSETRSIQKDSSFSETTERQRKENSLAHFLMWVLTILACIAFNITVSKPGSHPLLFAIGTSWMILFVTGIFTSRIFLEQDSLSKRFAGWEQEGKVYRFVGLGVYRWLLIRSPFALLAPEMKLRSGRSDFNRILREINKAEGVHAIAGVLTLILFIYLLIRSDFLAGIWTLIINLMLNIYPVMLQRWNRGRILRLMKREKK